MINNCLIYCRVSTEEQAREGFSLNAQEKFCRNYAKQQRMNIVNVYRDEGKSATNLNRPALQELLERCQSDKSINTVLVQETDRLARNTKDHLTIKAIFKKVNVRLISVAQPLLDESPEGNMIDTILASVNQFQSELSGRKVKKGMQERFEEGWYPSQAPLGYLNTTLGTKNNRKAKRIITEDPEKWYLIRKGFELYLTGNHSINTIRDYLEEKGLRARNGGKVHHSIMNSILKDPFYAGIMRWNGQEKKGKHKPMITYSQHKNVLKIMNNNNHNACRRRKHTFILKGYVICNLCGRQCVGDKHQAKNKEYYHCTTKGEHSNKGQNFEVSKLEKQVEQQFMNIQFSLDFIERFTSVVKDLYNQQKNDIKENKQTVLNQKIALERKRDFIEEKLFSNVISDDDFIRLSGSVKTQMDHLNRQLMDFEGQHEYDITVIQEVLKITRNIHETYVKADPDLKRRYLGIFWEKFLIQDKKIVKAVPTPIVKQLLRTRKVRIRSNWYASPSVIRTLTKLLGDREYWAKMRAKLDDLYEYQESMKVAV